MQKSFSVAICLFGLSLGTQQAEAGDRFTNHANIPGEVMPQMLAVADMAPVNIPEAQLPTNVINDNLSRIDPVKMVNKNPSFDQNTAVQKSDNSAPQQRQMVMMRAMSATEKAQLKNYAPFMRNLVMSANMMNSGPPIIKAARISRNGKQVIVLGGQ